MRVIVFTVSRINGVVKTVGLSGLDEVSREQFEQKVQEAFKIAVDDTAKRKRQAHDRGA